MCVNGVQFLLAFFRKFFIVQLANSVDQSAVYISRARITMAVGLSTLPNGSGKQAIHFKDSAESRFFHGGYKEIRLQEIEFGRFVNLDEKVLGFSVAVNRVKFHD